MEWMGGCLKRVIAKGEGGIEGSMGETYAEVP